MRKANFYFRNILLSANLVLLLSSCLGSSGKREADCGPGQKFDTLSRQCSSAQGAPIPELNSLIFKQDQEPEEFIVNYTDFQENSAFACQIQMESSLQNFSIRAREFYQSPQLIVLLEQRAVELQMQAGLSATVLNDLRRAHRDSLAAVSTSEMESALLTAAQSALTLAALVKNGDFSSTAIVRADLVEKTAEEVKGVAQKVANRCSCSGAVCYGVYDGKRGFHGTGGFSYTIQDQVGVSKRKFVEVLVTKINYPPMVSFIEREGNESSNSIPLPINFTIPLAVDKDNEFTDFYHYEIVSPPARGELSNCLIYNGIDLNCTYTPVDGDLNGEHGDRATAQNNQFVVTAKSAGVWGNRVQLRLRQNPKIRTGNINGAGGRENVVVRVRDYMITAYVDLTPAETIELINYSPTRVSDLIWAIENHPYASRMIEVGPNLATFTQGSDIISSAHDFILGGGSNGFDGFTYRAFDGSDYSIEGYVSLQVNFRDNLPTPVPFSVAMYENTPKTITLLFEDSDTLEGGVSCLVNTDSNLFITTSCQCLNGECQVELFPRPNYSGSASFFYNIATPRRDFADQPAPPGQVQWFESFQQVNVTILPVEKKPLAYFRDLKNGGSDFLESFTVVPETYSLPTFNPAVYHPNMMGVPSGTTYRIVTPPQNGDLVGACLSGTNFFPGQSCEYTPRDGNLNSGNPSPDLRYASFDNGDVGLRYRALFRGEKGNKLSFVFIPVSGLPNPVLLTQYDQDAGVLLTKVFVGQAATRTEVLTLINNDPYLKNLVEVTPIGPSLINPYNYANFQALSLAPLPADQGPVDYIEYMATTPDGKESFIGRYSIFITETENQPLVCQYSSYPSAPECGIEGCRGGYDHLNSVNPLFKDVVFYDHDSHVCYVGVEKSSGIEWEISEGFISDVITNERNQIRIDRLMFDSGDGGNLTLVSMTSSNTSMIPNDQVQLFYDGMSINVGGSFTPSGSSSRPEGEIRLFPSSGPAGVGETIISLRFENSDGITLDIDFKVKINNVAIVKGGWEHLRSIGPKVSNLPGGNLLVETPHACSASYALCRKGSEIVDCMGSSSPQGQVTPLDANALYYQKSNGKCFRAQQKGNQNSWVEFQTYCAISPSAYSMCTGPGCPDSGRLCPGASCILPSRPSTAQMNDLTYIMQGISLYIEDENKCYKIVQRSTDDLYFLREYNATGEVTLRWDNFQVFGEGAVTGYNVYRRVAVDDGTFDYRLPLNREPIPFGTNSFTDNGIHSNNPPLPETVYTYEVRPIILGIPTSTSDYDTHIRAMVPFNNQAFIHRWMANRSTCELMNRSFSRDDQTGPGEYACPYSGPGSIWHPDWGAIFDIEYDLIVDRFEAGCNYSRSPACSTASGDCISNQSPTSLGITATDGSIFYNRSSGRCYIRDGGWRLVDSTDLMDHRMPHLPPLVRMDQAQSRNFCRDISRDMPPAILGFQYADPLSALRADLPNRKEQLLYSIWDYKTLSDTQVSGLERGLGLNSSSKCNSSGADGLETFFTDTDVVFSSNAFTIAGTKSSPIRSLATGSEKTKACQSRFGVQDAVGNVAEWTIDQIRCRGTDRGLSICDAVGTWTDLPTEVAANSNYDFFRVGGQLNQVRGPCRQILPGLNCDAEIGQWTIGEQNFGASRWILPLGLPAHGDFIINNPGDAVIPDLRPIGSSAGITINRLHQNSITLNTASLFAEQSGIGALSTGGGFFTGQGAGRWHFETIPMTPISFDGADDIYILRTGDLAFRSFYPGSVNIINNGTHLPSVSCTIAGGEISVTIEIDSNFSTAQDIQASLRAACNPAEIDVFVSGDALETQVSTGGPLFLNQVTAASSGIDLGFRCVYPVDDTYYDD